MLRRYVILPAAALSLIGTPAFAGLQKVDDGTKTVGETTITWDSSFEDVNYRVGADIEMRVTWTVDAGAAMFSGFGLRGPEFTPKGPDPANGELVEPEPVMLIDDSGEAGTSGEVSVLFRFTELHCEEELDLELGNAHFSLFLDIDTDGDGLPDSEVGYGVNVHVEQPGPC